MAAPKGHKAYEDSGRPRKYTREKLDELAEDFLKYANDPENIIYRGWCAKHNHGEDFISDLVDSEKVLIEQVGGDAKFSRAQKTARILIGMRREEMALRGQFEGDTGIIKATLATYDLEHRAMLRDMKQAEAPKPTQVIIERARIEDDNGSSKDPT